MVSLVKPLDPVLPQRRRFYSCASEIKNRYSDGIKIQSGLHQWLCVAPPAYCGKIRV
jgi:hypothetical protein